MTMLNKCNGTIDFCPPGRPTCSRWCFYSWGWLGSAPSWEHSRFLFRKGWPAWPSLERRLVYPPASQPWKLLNTLLRLSKEFITQLRADLKILERHPNKYNYKANNSPTSYPHLHSRQRSQAKILSTEWIKSILGVFNYPEYIPSYIMVLSIR